MREQIIQDSYCLFVVQLVSIQLLVYVNNDACENEAIWLLDTFLKDYEPVFIYYKACINSSRCEYPNQRENNIYISDVNLILVLNLVQLYIYEGDY